jgi:hypothetical protein
MSQLNSFARAQNPDFVYFDIVNTNAKSSNSDLPDLRFVETRATPIIANTGDYRMSIVRFSIDTPNLPVLIVQPRPEYIDYTIYELTVNARTRLPTTGANALPYAYQGKSHIVQWTQDDERVQVPTTAPNKFSALDPYYWCHSYHWFLDIINNLLYEAHVAAVDAWLTLKGIALPVDPTRFYWIYSAPRFEWDSGLNAPVLYATNYYNLLHYPFAVQNPLKELTQSPTGLNAAPPLFEIAMNGPLHALFSGFSSRPVKLIPTGQIPLTPTFTISTEWYGLVISNTNANDLAWRVKTDKTPNATNPGIANSIQIPYLPSNNESFYPHYTNEYLDPFYGIYFRQASEVACTELWCPIAAIVFTSNLLPIVPNQLSNPIVYNEGVILSQTTDNNFAQIITDLATNEYGYRCNVLYTPTAEFRRIELTGNTPLTNLDVNVFWRSKFGELIPFRLSSGASASIKFLFERKPNIRDRFASMDLD